MAQETLGLPAGVILTLYHGDGLAAAWRTQRDLLARAQPAGVCLHAPPSELVANGAAVLANVRTLLPHVALSVGVACDWWLAAAAQEHCTLGVAAQTLQRAARTLVEAGCTAVLWDQEGAAEAHPEPAGALARELLATCRAVHPTVPQGLTTYDVPTEHARVPWSCWCGDGGVDFLAPQVYPVPPGGRTPPGGLQHRQDWSDRAHAAATAHGWMRAGLPRVPYYQAHGNRYDDLLAVAGAHASCLLWPPFDADGTRAAIDLQARACRP